MHRGESMLPYPHADILGLDEVAGKGNFIKWPDWLDRLGQVCGIRGDELRILAIFWTNDLVYSGSGVWTATTLSKRLGRSRTQVVKWISDLSGRGLITREADKRQGWNYHINIYALEEVLIEIEEIKHDEKGLPIRHPTSSAGKLGKT